jgi:hypothetical protein
VIITEEHEGNVIFALLIERHKSKKHVNQKNYRK